MNKAILTIASSFVLTLFGSAFVPVRTAPAEGYRAPDVVVTSASGDSVQQQSLIKAGRPVLLTFWNSNEAASRVACARYDRMFADSALKEQMSFVTVNLDRSEGVYRLTAQHDGLINGSHMHLDNTQARHVIEDYGLGDGCKSFLIDAQGVIVAVNPDHDTINKMLDN